MSLARSKVTAQAQISIPAVVRKKLGIGPGSVLQWEEDGDKIFVRRSGSYSFEDIRKAVFHDEVPEHHSLEELKSGIEKYIRERYARD